MQDAPHVAACVFIRKDNRILLGKRLGPPQPNSWCPPGGKVDLNEEVEAAARREVKEESNVECGPLQLIAYTDDIWHGAHYVTLHFLSEWKAGEAQTLEPEKFESWKWFPWSALPSPLFEPVENLIKKGFNPSNV